MLVFNPLLQQRCKCLILYFYRLDSFSEVVPPLVPSYDRLLFNVRMFGGYSNQRVQFVEAVALARVFNRTLVFLIYLALL